MKHPVSTTVRTLVVRTVDVEISIPIWNMIQIEVKEVNRAKVTRNFWDSVGRCTKWGITDNVSRSVSKKIKNKNTSTSS